jgi:hypothetical protein
MDRIDGEQGHQSRYNTYKKTHYSHGHERHTYLGHKRHTAGFFFGCFDDRYSVVFPMAKSMFFSQFLFKNSQFQKKKIFFFFFFFFCNENIN